MPGVEEEEGQKKEPATDCSIGQRIRHWPTEPATSGIWGERILTQNHALLAAPGEKKSAGTSNSDSEAQEPGDF